MGTEVATISDIERMAVAVSRSGLFGVKTQEQAMALMLIAQAEGLHPAIAARDYHIIQGRPALKSDAMLARFQQAGGKVRWVSMTNACVSGVFSHPQGGEIEIEWTIEMARSAKLTDKDTWKQYPRQMLRARCISEGIRTVFPGVIVGSYSEEEVTDMTLPAKESPTIVKAEIIKDDAQNNKQNPKDKEHVRLTKQINNAVAKGYKTDALSFMNRELGVLNKLAEELTDQEAIAIMNKMIKEASAWKKDPEEGTVQ